MKLEIIVMKPGEETKKDYIDGPDCKFTAIEKIKRALMCSLPLCVWMLFSLIYQGIKGLARAIEGPL